MVAPGFAVLRGGAMDTAFAHPLVLADVFTAELVVLAQNHTHAKQQYACRHQNQYDKKGFQPVVFVVFVVFVIFVMTL